MLRAIAALFFILLAVPEAGAAPIDDLCAAAEQDDLAAAQSAIDAGAGISEKGCIADATPLHRAAWARAENAVTLLVGAGANLEAQQADGATPLHIAMKNTYRIGAVIVNFLVAQGANVNAQDDNGETPLLSGLTTNSLSRNRNAFQTLLANGANPNLANNRGGAPLQVAAMLPGDSFFYTEKLLESGADVNLSGPGGRTALHNAAQWGTAQVVDLLLKSGANIHAETNNGETPLQLSESDAVSDVLRAGGACEADKHWNRNAMQCADAQPPTQPQPTQPTPINSAGGGEGGGGGGGGAGIIVAGGLLIVGAAWFLSGDESTLAFSPKVFYENDDGAEFSGFGGRVDWRGDGGNLFWEMRKNETDSYFEFGGATTWRSTRIRGAVKMHDETQAPEWRAKAEWRGMKNFRLYAEKNSGLGAASWGAEWRGEWGKWSARIFADSENKAKRTGAEAAILF